jgi:hypothetical protein
VTAEIFEGLLENHRGSGNFLYSSPRCDSGAADLDFGLDAGALSLLGPRRGSSRFSAAMDIYASYSKYEQKALYTRKFFQ